jgi:hypothetical protein
MYKPRLNAKHILDSAYRWVTSVAYQVTARWVFYRLLQSGVYSTKAGYKHLLQLLSKARKEFYEEWRPWTLADDTRSPILMQRGGYYTLYCRGWGFKDAQAWRDTVAKELNCPLDRWVDQPIYEELWFEAAAMQGQFLYYANENVPLLAFHGDISIPEKWRSAKRIADSWAKYQHPIKIFYFGDYDPKGLTIPQSAWNDIKLWAYSLVPKNKRDEFLSKLEFRRIGINLDQIKTMNIPENPERPGTYQWEGLDDNQAKALISLTNDHLDLDAFDAIAVEEQKIIGDFRNDLRQRYKG